MFLDPLPPVTNFHIFSDSLPLERDVLYGLPQGWYLGALYSRAAILFTRWAQIIQFYHRKFQFHCLRIWTWCFSLFHKRTCCLNHS